MTSAFDWRAIFWFLSIASSLSLLSFVLFFRDTFRRERSLNYQNLIKQRRKAAALPCSDDKESVHNDESAIDIDLEKGTMKQNATEQHRKTSPTVNLDLSLADVNPLKPLGQVLRRKNNIFILFSSGIE